MGKNGSKGRFVVALAGALALAALVGGGARADLGPPQAGPVFTVTDQGDANDGGCFEITCTFRDALIAAISSANAGHDAKIQFADGLTRPHPTQQPQIFPSSGSITIDGGGTVTLDTRNSVYSNGSPTFLTVSNGTVTLKNIEIADGPVTGLDVFGGNVELDNVQIDHNNLSAPSTEGGGLAALGGTTTINGGSIDHNLVQNEGGGIAMVGGTIIANGVAITDNSNDGSSPGGGVYVNGGSFQMSGGSLADNDAGNGGGIAALGGSVLLSRVAVTGNLSSLGGGIYAAGDSTVTVGNTTIAGNQAGSTGGGGGVYMNESANGSVALYGVTITGNTNLGIKAVAGSMNYQDVLLAGNTSAQCALGSLLTVGSLGNNLSTDGACKLTKTGDQPNVADSKIGPLSNGTVPLLAGSPALDAGASLGSGPYGTDVRGVSRPQGGGWDIGAYEAVEHQLATHVSGSGTVTPDSHGTTGGWYVDGTVVTLTAQASLGWAFTGWSGDCTGTSTQAPVTISADRSCTATFLQIQTPVVSSFAPSSGKAGDSVTITGTHFTATSGVTFGGTAATFSVASDTEIDTAVPNGASTGPIAVTNAAGTGTSSTNFVVVTAAPTVSSFAPETGKAGTAVTITGTDFLGASGVAFGGIAASSFTVNSDTQIVATVANAGDGGKVTVTNEIGTGTSDHDFTFIVPPALDSFTPGHGAVGASVQIFGSGLTGTTTVKFNTTVAPGFTVVDDGEIDATVPAGATNGKVSVTNIAGTAASTASFLVATGAPTVTGFTPKQGGAGMTVTVTGTHLGAATAVTFNGAEASFTRQTETTLTATVPEAAATGAIAVSNDLGTGTSAAAFTVLPVPAITSFAPASGTTGTTVTIAGTGLGSATKVAIAGKTMKVTLNTATEVKAVVPAGAATGTIAVTTPGGTATSTDSFQVIGAPVISSVSPASGKAGDTVAIMGSHLGVATAVAFAGTAADFSVVSDVELHATVSDGAHSGKLTVTSPAGTATSTESFVVVTQAPAVTSFTPATGKAGTVVTVTGTAFVGASDVTLGGVSASFKVLSDSKLTATVASAAASGKVAVVNAIGTGSSAGDFTFVRPPSVSSLAPASGKMTDAVTIAGSGFTGVSSVKFNGKAATFTVASDGEIDTAVPTGATTGKVTVTNLAGTAGSAFVVVTAKPAVTSFTPKAAGVGTTVTITGSRFAAASAVTFAGTTATFTVVSDVKLTATVPGGASSGPIAVTNELGTGASTASFTVVPPPTIDSLAPGEGKAGTAVAINGTNLALATAAKIGGKAMTITRKSASQLTAVIPAGATTNTIAVTTPGGTATSADAFVVILAPKITSFTPGAGSVGQVVAIHGSALTGVTGVKFGGVAASSVDVISDTEVDAQVPSGGKTGKIAVTNAAGSATSSGTFVVLTDAPAVTSFTPSTGKAQTAVTIVGTHLLGAAAVTFGGTAAASFTAVSDTKITAVVAAGGSSGKVAVVNAIGTGTSSGDFTFVAPPNVESLNPASGKVGDGVTIHGSGFTGATAVAFHGKAATFTVAGDGEIDTTVPAGATSGTVTVKNIAGTVASSTTFVVVTAAPVITSFSPASAPIGATVTILGSHLLGATSVEFNGTPATFVSIVSDTKLTATVPSGATSGPISVTNAIGTGTSSGSVTVPAPSRRPPKPGRRPSQGTAPLWFTRLSGGSSKLRGKDSNLDYLIQSQASYH